MAETKTKTKSLPKITPKTKHEVHFVLANYSWA